MATVLIADDDAAVREVLTAVLQRRGHAVVAVPDGRLALARLGDGPTVDVALVDWAMPGGGAPLLRSLREWHPEIPVVLMSGSIWDFGDLEADAFLRKPFTLPEVDQVLATALAAGKGERRRSPRLITTLRAEVRTPAGVAAGLVRDVSHGGAQLRVRSGAPAGAPGETVEGVLFGPGGRELRVAAKVVYRRPSPSGEDRLGLAFDDPKSVGPAIRGLL